MSEVSEETDAMTMGETVGERVHKLVTWIARYGEWVYGPACEGDRDWPDGEDAASQIEERMDAYEAAIVAAFEGAERADRLDRAVSLLIKRQLEAGDCPHYDGCPHDPSLRPHQEFGDSVCEECWRQAILDEAAREGSKADG